MKYLFGALILVLITPLFLHAQSNYKPAFVVNIQGDTSRGYIDYKQMDQSPKVIRFIKNLAESQPNLLNVHNITAFSITDRETFNRFVLSISKNETDAVKLGNRYTIDTTFAQDTVFAKVLFKGRNLSVYSYTDDLKTRYYIADARNPHPEELRYAVTTDDKKYSSNNATANYGYREITGYKTQLLVLAHTYNPGLSDLNRKVNNARYQERDLINLVEQINNDKHVEKVASQFGMRWFAGGAAIISKFNFRGEGGMPRNHTESRTLPYVGVGADLFLNKDVQKVYFRTELGFSTGRYSYANIGSALSNDITSSLDFKQSNIMFTPQVVWNVYNAPAFKVFLSAGGTINYSIYNDYVYTEKYYNVSEISKPKFPDFSKLWGSLKLKTGVEISRTVMLHLGYSPKATLAQASGYEAKMSGYEFGFNYIFGKH